MGSGNRQLRAAYAGAVWPGGGLLYSGRVFEFLVSQFIVAWSFIAIGIGLAGTPYIGLVGLLILAITWVYSSFHGIAIQKKKEKGQGDQARPTQV